MDVAPRKGVEFNDIDSKEAGLGTIYRFSMPFMQA